LADVNIHNVCKAYGAHAVLHDVSLTIKDTEFAVLVGPSGCGKSTLLRMIAGLEEISSGQILIGGREVNDLSPSQRDIAMVFQNYALYPHKTVRQNISFPLKVRKERKDVIEQRVLGAAEMLGLVPFLDRYPRQLSGGQRQRVAMGRALVRDPEVFLFDEPLSNLDAKLRVQMRSEIRQLHKRLGVTSIYVTHDQIEAMTMASTIIVLNAGRVEQVGTPKELYETPANRFVATFIGSPTMNLFPAAISGSKASSSLDVAGGTLSLGCSMAASPDRAVEVGVRPEHFFIAGSGIAGRIKSLEYTGSEVQAFVDTGGGRPCVAVLRGVDHLREGEPITLSCMPEHLHLFDNETGARLREQDLGA
jgi:multiple sugar transport system ATP-binding protein